MKKTGNSSQKIFYISFRCYRMDLNEWVENNSNYEQATYSLSDDPQPSPQSNQQFQPNQHPLTNQDSPTKQLVWDDYGILPQSSQSNPPIIPLTPLFSYTNDLQQNDLQQMGLAMGQQILNQQTDLLKFKTVENSTKLFGEVFTKFRYAFAVDNEYVYNKLKIILIPWFKSDWHLQYQYDADNPIAPR